MCKTGGDEGEAVKLVALTVARLADATKFLIGYRTVGGARVARNELRCRGTRKYCISDLPTLATKMMRLVPAIRVQETKS